MFDRTKFEVSLTVEKVTRVPFSEGKIFVRWRVMDSPRPDAHGRTDSNSVRRNEVKFDYSTKFSQRIRQRTPSKLLRNCPCRFEVVWEPLGGKGVSLGSLNLDIEQFARLPNQTDEDLHFGGRRVVAGQSIPFLLKGARSNCLVSLKIDLKYVSGTTEYEIPEFSAPTVNSGVDNNDEENDQTVLPGQASHSKQDREKLRHLREEVLQDLLDDPALEMNMKWHNLDYLLQGEEQRLIPDQSESFARQGVRDPRTDWDVSAHKPGTPYLETEVRDNFITWNVFGPAAAARNTAGH